MADQSDARLSAGLAIKNVSWSKVSGRRSVVGYSETSSCAARGGGGGGFGGLGGGGLGGSMGQPIPGLSPA